MSVNRYDASTGELTNIASGQRTWVGTKAAYKSAKDAGTLPNNAIIAITDDEQDHNHYSTEETETGIYWIDGKPIYRKVIDCGTLPNKTTKDTAHNIQNLETVVSLDGKAYRPSDGLWINIPHVNTSNIASGISMVVYNGNIEIADGVDYSAFTTSFVIIEYTKSTD